MDNKMVVMDSSVCRGQSGVALVTSLVILLVLSLLALAGMQSSVLEERMAGNMSNRNLAFQAAEAALRDAEYFLESATLPAFDGSGGLYQPTVAGTASRWNLIAWDDTDSRQISGTDTISDVAQQPRYIIEDMGALESTASGSLVASEPVPDNRVYRVTARGVGGTATAIVMLQCTFKK